MHSLEARYNGHVDDTVATPDEEWKIELELIRTRAQGLTLQMVTIPEKS